MLRLEGQQPITPQDVDKLVCAQQWIQEKCPERDNNGCTDKSTLCLACKLCKLVKNLMTHSCTTKKGGCHDPDSKKKRTPVQLADSTICAKEFPKPEAASAYFSSEGRWCYR
jgi:hypothetical protein